MKPMTSPETTVPEIPLDQQTARQPIVVWLPRALITLALVAFVGYLVVYFIYAVNLFRFPFDYDQGEGFELVDTIAVQPGRVALPE
jgi:hypothetical protein